MSKYIPTDNKPKGQVKPKLKVKVKFNEEERTLNEYDAFQMISELKQSDSQQNKIIQDLTEAVTGIMDAMSAATSDVSISPPAQQSTAPVQTKLKLPKLNKVTSTLDAPKDIYPNASDNVKLES
jgi:hypothetical protein